ncbi:hypothetical protein [Streptomyces melanogenes]|uniref:hypothetical protein n=1 Tax=Streptomyces melanogenes TaxID=67326 RepID=UPI0037B455D2
MSPSTGRRTCTVARPRHPNITAELLVHLLADPDLKVADDAAANPALPRARMDHILTEAGL